MTANVHIVGKAAAASGGFLLVVRAVSTAPPLNAAGLRAAAIAGCGASMFIG